MVTQKQGAPETPNAQDESNGQNVDPRNTDHPAGDEQAAENAADESPS